MGGKGGGNSRRWGVVGWGEAVGLPDRTSARPRGPESTIGFHFWATKRPCHYVDEGHGFPPWRRGCPVSRRQREPMLPWQPCKSTKFTPDRPLRAASVAPRAPTRSRGRAKS